MKVAFPFLNRQHMCGICRVLLWRAPVGHIGSKLSRECFGLGSLSCCRLYGKRYAYISRTNVFTVILGNAIEAGRAPKSFTVVQPVTLKSKPSERMTWSCILTDFAHKRRRRSTFSHALLTWFSVVSSRAPRKHDMTSHRSSTYREQRGTGFRRPKRSYQRKG